MAKKSAGGLLEAVRAIQPAARTTWFNKLSTERQAELIALRAAFQRGEFSSGANTRSIHAIVVKEFGISINENTFGRWLRETDSE